MTEGEAASDDEYAGGSEDHDVAEVGRDIERALVLKRFDGHPAEKLEHRDVLSFS